MVFVVEVMAMVLIMAGVGPNLVIHVNIGAQYNVTTARRLDTKKQSAGLNKEMSRSKQTSLKDTKRTTKKESCLWHTH